MDMARSLGHVDGGQEEALEALLERGEVVEEPVAGEQAVYLHDLCEAEQYVAFRLWELAAGEQGELRREEAFLLLVGRLLERCGGCPRPPEEVRPEVRAVCDYLEAHCDRRITLEQLSTLAGLSKYHLLRCFTRQKGITPYRYLETVRVNRARALLEQGAAPLDAALRAGFADQSHFNHFFKILTGLTPSQYRAVFAAEQGEM